MVSYHATRRRVVDIAQVKSLTWYNKGEDLSGFVQTLGIGVTIMVAVNNLQGNRDRAGSGSGADFPYRPTPAQGLHFRA